MLKTIFVILITTRDVYVSITINFYVEYLLYLLIHHEAGTLPFCQKKIYILKLVV